MNIESFVDPKVVGPGAWFMIHLQAYHATTNERKKAFELMIEDLVTNFKCLKCKKHFSKYIQRNPLSDYRTMTEDGKDIGYFLWSWKLHNEVNSRLKKSVIPFDDAIRFFSGIQNNVCTNCGDEVTIENKKEKKKDKPKVPQVVNQLILEHIEAPVCVPVSKSIPDLLTLYRSGMVKAKPFKN